MSTHSEPSFTLTDEQKFDALKMRHEDQTELLRCMSAMDFQIFGGFISLQLLLGSWLGEHALSEVGARIGLALIDAALTVTAAALIHNNYKRRQEIISTLKNIFVALQFSEPGAYITHAPLNGKTQFRPWRIWYLIGICSAFSGILLLLFVRHGS